MKSEGVRHDEAIIRHSEGLRLGKPEPCKEESYWFVEVNEPSAWQWTWGLAKNSHFFLPFLAILKAHFLKPINWGYFRLVKGSVFEGRTLSLGLLLSSS